MVVQTLVALLPALAAATAILASQQTSTYVYDVHGRMTANATAASSGNSSITLYNFDAASNRTSLASGAVPPRANIDQMASGEVLLPGQAVVSADAQSRLELRSSGALVLTCNGAIQWSPVGPNGEAAQLVMQGAGNLVLYSPSYTVLWASGGGGYPGAYLVLQSDGNLVIYQGSTPIWATFTSC